jgi:ABC-type transport system involved in cytochrome c biogenesis permease subunit
VVILSWDPKETWAFTWLVSLIYMPDHKGWEGKRTAILGGQVFVI